MKTFVLTCPELDGGYRKARFETSRFPNVGFVNGMSKNDIRDSLGIAGNSFNYGSGDCSWDAGAMAVAYGHLGIWKSVVESSQLCLVLEDDAQPVSRFCFDYFKIPEFVASLRLDGKWVLSLWKRGIWSYRRFGRKILKVCPSYGNSGAVGYVIGPESAQYLVDGFADINCPLDHYLLGMGSRHSPEYSVFVTRRNRIGHRLKRYQNR